MKTNWLCILLFAFFSCKKEKVNNQEIDSSSNYITQVYNYKLLPADTFVMGFSDDYYMPIPLTGGDSVLIDLNLDGKNDYILCAYHTYERVSNIRSQDHHYFRRLFGLDSTCQIAVTDCKFVPMPWISPDSVNCRIVDRLVKGDSVNEKNTWDEKNYFSTKSVNGPSPATLAKYEYVTVGHFTNFSRGNYIIGLRIFNNSKYYYGYLDMRIPSHFGLDNVHQLLLRKTVFNPVANESINIDL